jgi:hypothetical protein
MAAGSDDFQERIKNDISEMRRLMEMGGMDVEKTVLLEGALSANQALQAGIRSELAAIEAERARIEAMLKRAKSEVGRPLRKPSFFGEGPADNRDVASASQTARNVKQLRHRRWIPKEDTKLRAAVLEEKKKALTKQLMGPEYRELARKKRVGDLTSDEVKQLASFESRLKAIGWVRGGWRSDVLLGGVC